MDASIALAIGALFIVLLLVAVAEDERRSFRLLSCVYLHCSLRLLLLFLLATAFYSATSTTSLIFFNAFQLLIWLVVVFPPISQTLV